MSIGVEDGIGLGGDLDGISATPTGVTGIESYPRIIDMLLRSGLTVHQAEKVRWSKMARVLREGSP